MSAASHQSRQAVREELRERLEHMEFSAFAQVIKQLLFKSGYLSVQLAGRNYKRGRTPKGGLDLTARSATDLSSCLTLAQVKQYRRVVSRRFVDELRGAMSRHGAEQGLLITMSTFSKVARAAAKEGTLAPIKLIEGEEILSLLFAYRIGVMEQAGKWQIDAGYLDKLQKRSISAYRSGIYKNRPCREALPPSKHQPDQLLTKYPNVLQPNSQQLDTAKGGGMTWSTHLMAGLNALWLLEMLPGAQTENMALLASAAALGSLLPDLDASESKIKHVTIGGIKPFLLPSQAIYRQLGHRTFLHSLVGLTFVATAAAVLIPFVGKDAAWALWLGYGSHLIADGITRSGIPLLYPRPKRFHFLPKKLRIVTGSLAEDVIFVLLSLSALTLMLLHLGV